MLVEARVGAVLLTGDVTHRGLAAELLRYERIFAPLLDAGRLLAVPGNHDRMGDDAGPRHHARRPRGGEFPARASRGPRGLHRTPQPFAGRRTWRALRPGRRRRRAGAPGRATGRGPGGDAAPPRAAAPGGGPGREAGDLRRPALRRRASPRRGPARPDRGALPARAPRPPARARRVPGRPAWRAGDAHPERRKHHVARTRPHARPPGRRGRLGGMAGDEPGGAAVVGPRCLAGSPPRRLQRPDGRPPGKGVGRRRSRHPAARSPGTGCSNLGTIGAPARSKEAGVLQRP